MRKARQRGTCALTSRNGVSVTTDTKAGVVHKVMTELRDACHLVTSEPPHGPAQPRGYGDAAVGQAAVLPVM